MIALTPSILCMFALGVCVTMRSTAALDPTTVTDNMFFHETFDEGNVFDMGKWVKSTDIKYADQPVLVKPASKPAEGFEDDKGVQLTQEMKHYGFASKFDFPFNPRDKDEFVVQYEVKLEDTLDCGGAYIKLLRSTDPEVPLDITALNSDSPYSIMFGPDKCGGNNKVHFIVQHQNPVTGTFEEKHFNETVKVKAGDKHTHLYTLRVRNDNTFELYIDMVLTNKGSLLTHLVPPINPNAVIDDPADIKPVNWVDDPEIPDPTKEKPEDWDETEPRKISDPSATKPEGWLDSAPIMIPDPEATKPEDWDDEEDGEWEAPLVQNPACDSTQGGIGCGKWTPPTINNPAYKGKWVAPKIANPDYKGPWSPAQIPNPAYFKDDNPYSSIEPFSALAVEVWTTSAGIFFDNFLIADSLDAAFSVAQQTFAIKSKAEVTAEQIAIKQRKAAEREEAIAKGDWKTALTTRSIQFMENAVDYLSHNPWAMVASVIAVSVGFFYLIIGGESSTGSGSYGSSRNNNSAATTSTSGSETSTTQQHAEVDCDDDSDKSGDSKPRPVSGQQQTEND